MISPAQWKVAISTLARTGSGLRANLQRFLAETDDPVFVLWMERLVVDLKRARNRRFVLAEIVEREPRAWQAAGRAGFALAAGE
jgi:hypothetical protein